MTQALDDFDDIEEEVPEDDEALDEAESQADEDLESLFGGAPETDEELPETEETSTETEAESQDDEDSFTANDDEDYVDIDSLMAEADEEDEDDDRYESSAVKDVLPDEDAGQEGDAPADDDPAGQLDLARAYIEMDEKDEAREILQQLIDGDDEALAEEAKTLKNRLDS